MMASFPLGRHLMLNYPRIFSFGYISKKGVSEKRMNNAKFKMTIYANGWDKALPEASSKYSSPPNKTLVVTITGSNPAYGTTCAGVLLCAITILKEINRISGSGGVWTPGAAFYDTSLIKRLNHHKDGYKFWIES